MDQDMATNLTLTLSVGWKVGCNNVGADIQTVTNVFQVNLRTVLEINNII